MWLVGSMPVTATNRSARRPLRRAATIAVAVLAVGTIGGIESQPSVNADISSGDRPVFIPIDPCRLADTRPGTNNVGNRARPIGVAETITIEARGTQGKCSLPTDATGLSLNITALHATQLTFLTIWPGGARLLAASLNPAPGQPPTPNAVNALLSTTGAFSIYNDAGSVDVVIDVNGYYVPHDHDDRYPRIADVYAKTDTYSKSEVYARSEVYPKTVVDQKLTAAEDDLAESTSPYAPVYGQLTTASRYAGERFGGGIAATIDPFGAPLIAAVELSTNEIELIECVSTTCSATLPSQTTQFAPAVEDLIVEESGDSVIAYRTAAGELRLGFCSQRCATTSSVSIATNASAAKMAMGRNGPVVVYENLDTKQVVLTACGGVACSTTTHTNLAPTTTGFGEADIMATDYGPIVAVFTSATPGIEIITCVIDTCDGTQPFAPIRTTLVSGPGIGFSPSIAATNSGRVAVAYRETTTPGLRLAICKNNPCVNDPATAADDPIVEQLSTSGNEGFNPTLAFDIAGAAVVIHENGAGDQLLTWCNPPAFGTLGECDGSRNAQIVLAASSGNDADLIIGRDGHPIVVWTNSGDEMYLDYVVGAQSVDVSFEPPRP